MFRVIVAGGRDFSDYNLMKKSLDDYFANCGHAKRELRIVCGLANGADKLGYRYANDSSIQVDSYPADWTKYGRSAGYKRNVVMSENADALVAFWDGKSLGTKHMITTMINKHLPVKIIRYTKSEENNND